MDDLIYINTYIRKISGLELIIGNIFIPVDFGCAVSTGGTAAWNPKLSSRW